jgi:hypothetical protein
MRFIVYLEDIDPDTGWTSQVRPMAEAEDPVVCQLIVKAMKDWDDGDEPNRDYYYLPTGVMEPLTAEELEDLIYAHMDSLPYAGGYPEDWRETLSEYLIKKTSVRRSSCWPIAAYQNKVERDEQ